MLLCAARCFRSGVNLFLQTVSPCRHPVSTIRIPHIMWGSSCSGRSFRPKPTYFCSSLFRVDILFFHGPPPDTMWQEDTGRQMSAGGKSHTALATTSPLAEGVKSKKPQHKGRILSKCILFTVVWIWTST